MLVNVFKNTENILISLPRPIKIMVIMFLDIVISILSTWLSFGARLDDWNLVYRWQYITIVIACFIYIVFYFKLGLQKIIFRFIGRFAFELITKCFLLYFFAFFVLISIIGIDQVPRSIGIIQPAFFYLMVLGSRFLITKFLKFIREIELNPLERFSSILIYSSGADARQLAAGIFESKSMRLKGYIDDDFLLQGSTINGIPIYPSTKLKELVTKLDITDVLLPSSYSSQSKRKKIIASLSGNFVRIRTLPKLNNVSEGGVSPSDLGDLDINDLLGRAVVPPDYLLMDKSIRGKDILVTGAGGSIGSELCRQIVKFEPKSLILLDSSEHNLYLIYEELKAYIKTSVGTNLESSLPNTRKPNYIVDSIITIIPRLASVRNEKIIFEIFNDYKPDTVFHAAAYKHVPLVETNPSEGVLNNVVGTLICSEMASKVGVTNFILISTDKAVRPTNLMGASKRIAELVLQALSQKGGATIFSIVRFGNVLGSSGSVVPMFVKQIKEGGPISLTHRDVTRYFMTIPEAAQLVIQSGAMATGGDVFILDMGEPVRIYDLAVKLIYLSGLMPKDESNLHGDIEIKVSGLRPGEKLYEELLIGNNPEKTNHSRIMKAHEEFLPWGELKLALEEVNQAFDSRDIQLVQSALKKLVPGYNPFNELINKN